MKKTYRQGVQVLLAIVALSGFTVASAAEVPPRQPGLWKHTQYEGNDRSDVQVVYQCVDEATEDRFLAMAKHMGSCTEEPMTRKGAALLGSNVCQIMGSKVTTEYVVSGNMKTEFRVESVSTNEPPLFGEARTESLVLMEWQGACKPGQKPGDMLVEQDGELVTFSMDQLERAHDMSRMLENIPSPQGMEQMMEQLRKMQPHMEGSGVDIQELGKMMEQLRQLQATRK